MGAFVYAAGFLPLPLLPLLALQILTGIGVYIGISAAFSVPAFSFAVKMLKNMREGRKE